MGSLTGQLGIALQLEPLEVSETRQRRRDSTFVLGPGARACEGQVTRS